MMIDAVNQELFVDRIGEVRFVNSVFRIDLVSFGSDPEQPTISQRVVMTPDGFMQSLATMQEMLRKMIAAGLVEDKKGAQPVTLVPPSPVSSPNFPGV